MPHSSPFVDHLYGRHWVSCAPSNQKVGKSAWLQGGLEVSLAAERIIPMALSVDRWPSSVEPQQEASRQSHTCFVLRASASWAVEHEQDRTRLGDWSWLETNELHTEYVQV